MKSPLKIIQTFYNYETGNVLFSEDVTVYSMEHKAFWVLSGLNSFYAKLKHQLLKVPKDTLLLTTYRERIIYFENTI